MRHLTETERAEMVNSLDRRDFRREILADMAWRWNSSPWASSKSPRKR